MPIEVEIALLLFTVAVLGWLGYLVYYRNRSDTFMRFAFLIQSVFAVLWTLASLARIVDNSMTVSEFGARLAYSASAGVAATWMVIFIALSHYHNLRKISAIISCIVWLVIGVGLVMIPGAMVAGVGEPPDRTVYFGDQSWIYNFYVLIVGSILYFLAIANIIKSRTQLERVRQTVISFVFIACFSVVAVVDVVMPMMGNFSLYWLGPIMLLLLTSGIALAMYRYRLLNFSSINSETINENLVIDISRLLIKNDDIIKGLQETIKQLSNIMEIRVSAVEIYDSQRQIRIGEKQLMLGKNIIGDYVKKKKGSDEYASSMITLDDIEFSDPMYEYFRDHHISYSALFGNERKGVQGAITVRITGNKIWGVKQTSLLTTIGNTILLAYENSKTRLENLELRRIDTAKDEVLNIASHNLRTPISVVRGYLELSLSNKIEEIGPQTTRFLTSAQNELKRMARIVDDFLTLSRIQMKRFELRLSSANVKDLVTAEVENLSIVATAKRLALTLNVKPGEYRAMIDQSKMRQVITNLIDNAMHYSGKSHIIMVRLSSDDKNIMFSVEDHGIGVPESDRNKLWQKFSRGTNAKTYRPDGTGTGLYMIRRIVEDHHGQVFYKPLQQGSLFGFIIPHIPEGHSGGGNPSSESQQSSSTPEA